MKLKQRLGTVNITQFLSPYSHLCLLFQYYFFQTSINASLIFRFYAKKYSSVFQNFNFHLHIASVHLFSFKTSVFQKCFTKYSNLYILFQLFIFSFIFFPLSLFTLFSLYFLTQLVLRFQLFNCLYSINIILHDQTFLHFITFSFVKLSA